MQASAALCIPQTYRSQALLKMEATPACANDQMSLRRPLTAFILLDVANGILRVSRFVLPGNAPVACCVCSAALSTNGAGN